MPYPRDAAPALSVPLVSGGEFNLADHKAQSFTIVVFYRGKHCPICKTYLNEIQDLLAQAADQGIEVLAVSMDSEDRGKSSAQDWGLDRLVVGYRLSEAQARNWGLYISSQRPGSQEPERFSEPGLFVIKPDGTIFFAQVQSAPFTRPDFAKLLGGLKFVVENDYPARGDLTKAA